jgi:ATP-binding cassette, subfamily B, bacterial
MSSRRYGNLEIFRRLLREAKNYRPHLLSIFFLTLLETPLTLLTPIPLKIAVDSVIGSQPAPQFLGALLPSAATGAGLLVFAVLLLVMIALSNQLHAMATSLLHTYTGEKLVLAFRAQLFRHVQRLSLSYHDTKGTTDSTYRIQYDAPAIQWILVDGIVPFISAGFMLAGIIYVTARIDWQLAVVALAVSPILFLLSRVYSRRLRDQWHEFSTLQSSAMSVVQEVLTAVRVVRAFGQEDREHERFVRHSSRTAGARLRLALAECGFDLFVGLSIALGMAAILWIGTRHVLAGVLTLGNLLLITTYISQIYGPLATISKKIADLQSSLTSAERAFSLLDEAPDVPERADARPLNRSRGHIIFRKVSFGYAKNQPVLQNVSFEVGPGARAGIVGATGAGKTTLVTLLTRFYDPTAGQILLDGIDLRDFKLADLRNQFAIVLQEPVLFSTSIAENIGYARPSATQNEIIQAAKAANAHRFITALPGGYHTRVGERGMRLSGGERQRIALARAFLKDAPILILDEPTSALDVKTESEIMDAMDRLMENHTTFIITHRVSLLKNCDLELVIDSGRLANGTCG